MVTTVSTNKSRPFYKNKYVEYRKMYDQARNFSQNLDTAKNTSSSPSATKSPLPAEPAKQAEAADIQAEAKPAIKSLANRSGGSPYGVKSHSAPAATSQPDFPAPSMAAPTSGAPVYVPNVGSASDRMVDKVREYEPYIRAAADRYGIPANLIAGVIWQESRGNPRAVSHCGAMGLMQLMPATAASLGVTNAFDPAQNIDGGAKYLRQMLDRFSGRVDFAVAAYNAGPGNVAKHGGIPPFRETQDYVPKVLGFANGFQVAGAFQHNIPTNAIRA